MGAGRGDRRRKERQPPEEAAPEKRPRERLVGELAGGLCRKERVDVPGRDAEFGEDLCRVLADPGQHQAGAVGWRGAAADERADLLEVAPVGGLVADHPAELPVHRVIEDGAAEVVAAGRLS